MLPPRFVPDREAAAPQRQFLCAAASKTVDESSNVRRVRGPSLSSAAAELLKCASEKEGVTPLSSLSQDFKTTGAYGRSDAWRARTGPPEGAFDGCIFRPPPDPVRDHRIHLHSPITIAGAPGLPRAARRCVLVMTKSVGACRPWARHTLEDGVANAEAPSSREGPTRVFEFVRRSLASARIGLEGDPAVAPKTDASSEYCLTGA